MGAAFLTKMLEGFLVCPRSRWPISVRADELGNGSSIFSVPQPRCRRGGLVGAAVQLVPATARPYVGGSTDNTVLHLAFGYNGIGRIVGRHGESDAIRDWHGMSAFGSRPGMQRLFTGEMGNEIAWLLLVALFAAAFGVYLAARRKLSRDELCALMLWCCWLVVTGVVFSFMGGTEHPYYTVALAPAVAALIGLGGLWAWRLPVRLGRPVRNRRDGGSGGRTVNSTVAQQPLRGRLVGTDRGSGRCRGGVRGPAPSEGGRRCGDARTGSRDRRHRRLLRRHRGDPSSRFDTVRRAVIERDRPLDVRRGGQQTLAALLSATHTTWSAATNGSQSAAVLEIASGTSVMAVGGWSTDPVPALQQFIDDVHAGKVSYYIEAGRAATEEARHGEVIRGPNRSISRTREIADWVAAHYPATTIGGSMVYRLI